MAAAHRVPHQHLRPAWPGGSEYRLPRKAISAWLLTVRSTCSTAGNGAGTGRNGSASASAPTVLAPASRIRLRPSSLTHSGPGWPAPRPTVTSSARVRHQRCAIVCAASCRPSVLNGRHEAAAASTGGEKRAVPTMATFDTSRSRRHEETVAADLTEWAAVRAATAGLARRVAADVTAECRPASRVGVRVRFAPFTTHSRSTTLAEDLARPRAVDVDREDRAHAQCCRPHRRAEPARPRADRPRHRRAARRTPRNRGAEGNGEAPVADAGRSGHLECAGAESSGVCDLADMLPSRSTY